jgi:hypothetical protein
VLESLGVNLRVTVPIAAATIYPGQDCRADRHVLPLTVSINLGREAAGYGCSGSSPTPYDSGCGCDGHQAPPASTCEACKVRGGRAASAGIARSVRSPAAAVSDALQTTCLPGSWPSLAPASSPPQNSKCTLPDTLGRPLNTLAGSALSNLLSGLTGISKTCPAGSNLLRLNLTTHTNVSAGILSLYATADGKLGLALKLNCHYVLVANASVIVTGTVLGQPVHIYVPIAVKDGGLVSCLVTTVTTAIPGLGCLLASLDPSVNLNLPLSLRLGPDNSGCTGIIPGLAGSLLASLGIDLKVTVPVRAATLYPQDGTCRVADDSDIEPLTVSMPRQLAAGLAAPCVLSSAGHAGVWPTCLACLSSW